MSNKHMEFFGLEGYGNLIYIYAALKKREIHARDWAREDSGLNDDDRDKYSRMADDVQLAARAIGLLAARHYPKGMYDDRTIGAEK